MYKKIFYRELIGKKRILYSIFLVFLFIYAIIAFLTHNFEEQLNKNNMPAAEYCGIVDVNMQSKDLKELKDYIESNESYSNIKVVSCMNSSILTMSSGPLYSVNLDVNAFKDEYLNKKVKSMLSEGRLPQNSKEILVGNYFLKYFGLNLGDNIGKSPLYHKDRVVLGYLHLELDKDFDIEQLKDYKIVGIIDNEYYKFSIIRRYEPNYKSNKILFYFKNSNGYEQYESMSDDYNIGLMKNKLVGKQSLFYNISKTVSLISTMIIEIVILFVIIILVLMYLTKGMKKKVGILKSLGINDKTIIKIFASNLLYLLIIIDIISIGVTFLIFNLLNNSINSYYGFVINTYQLSVLNIIVNVCFTLITYISIIVCIKLRTIKTTPKNSILRG